MTLGGKLTALILACLLPSRQRGLVNLRTKGGHREAGPPILQAGSSTYNPAMGRIIRRLKQLRLRPFDRGDYTVDGERRVENTDALGAARGNQSPQGGSIPSGYPPGYVPPADEGRPRH